MQRRTQHLHPGRRQKLRRILAAQHRRQQRGHIEGRKYGQRVAQGEERERRFRDDLLEGGGAGGGAEHACELGVFVETQRHVGGGGGEEFGGADGDGGGWGGGQDRGEGVGEVGGGVGAEVEEGDEEGRGGEEEGVRGGEGGVEGGAEEGGEGGGGGGAEDDGSVGGMVLAGGSARRRFWGFGARRIGGGGTCLSMMVIIGATRVEAQNAAVRSEAMRHERLWVLYLSGASKLSMGAVTVPADVRRSGGGAGPMSRLQVRE